MPTIKDVAQATGIAVSSVSDILNGGRAARYAAHTVGLVRETAQRIGYTPHHFARSLKRGRTNIIGITSGPDVPVKELFSNLYFSEVYTGVGEVLAGQGYKMIFQQNDETLPGDSSLEMVRSNMVDGLVYILLANHETMFRERQLPLLRALGVPFIVVHSLTADLGCPAVGVDCAAAAYQATVHLLRHGYETVGFLDSQEKVDPLRDACLAGYRKALATQGVQYNPRWHYSAPGRYVQPGAEAAQICAAQPDHPRAVFASSSFLAHGFIAGLRRAGRRVPDDIAVMAFGDHVDPRSVVNELSIVRQPAHEKGRRAATDLLALITRSAAPASLYPVLVEAEPVLLSSCGCGKSAAIQTPV